MDVLVKTVARLDDGIIPPKYAALMRQFYTTYMHVLERDGLDYEVPARLFPKYLELVMEQIASPHSFQPYHSHLLEPFDYYRFGTDLFKGVADLKHSSARHLEHLDVIEKQLEAGDNVVMLANHQSEADPQVMSILLEATHPRFAQEIIFIAGERVVTDPMAIPFSVGRNLICIYSKRRMDDSTRSRAEMLMHNRRTMKLMASLLKEGGKAIFVAPSGGRDRPDENGVVQIAPFDASSIEMIRLMASHSGRPCRFYPLALASYNLLPPPRRLGKEIGEERMTHGGPLHLSFGPEIDMNNFPGSDERNKHKRRDYLSAHVEKIVCDLYHDLPVQTASSG